MLVHFTMAAVMGHMSNGLDHMAADNAQRVEKGWKRLPGLRMA